MPLSSSGLGRKVFNLETGVRFSVGVLTICQSGNGTVCKTVIAGSIPDMVLEAIPSIKAQMVTLGKNVTGRLLPIEKVVKLPL